MKHIERRHEIVLAGPVERVFPLFTPAGEKLWVDDWNPEFLHPAESEAVQGMIFRTTHGNEETLWACTEWDPSVHRVRYARVTPTSRFGFVEVACRRLRSDRTAASVTYEFTALNTAGEDDLAALSPQDFAEMIDGWRLKIDSWLSRSPGSGSVLAPI